jgi:hypothetical protein
MNSRLLTIYSLSVYNRKEYPFIRLQGKWLERLGFGIGRKIIVEERKGELLLKLAQSDD